MEGTRRTWSRSHFKKGQTAIWNEVLILVLNGHGLGGIDRSCYYCYLISLNPCFKRTWSRRQPSYDLSDLTLSVLILVLNGHGLGGLIQRGVVLLPPVLILVLNGHGLGEQKS